MLLNQTLWSVGDFFFCSTRIWDKKNEHKKMSQLHPAPHNFNFCFKEVLRRFLHTCQQKVPPCPWHIRRTEQTVTVRILQESLQVSTKQKLNEKITFKKYALFQRMLRCQLLLHTTRCVRSLTKNWMRSNRTTILLIEKKLSESWGNHWVKANDNKLW